MSGGKQYISLTARQFFVKRMFDIIFSILMLVALSPVMLAIWVMLYLEGGGPIIFKQRRYTYDGKEFPLHKFRTMRSDALNSPISMHSVRSDPRITRLGAFLRRTSLDEMPQLVSVLRGDMSIIGPRPKSLLYNEAYQKQSQAIIAVKPGITGWAQVNGWRGETDTLDKLQKRYEFDRYYVEHWSLMFEFKILVQTIVSALSGRNAY